VAGFTGTPTGYLAHVCAVSQYRERSPLHEWLRLKGYVAFNLPRAVTALGGALLLGVAATHVYVLASRPGLPALFVGYAVGVAAWCVLAAVAMWLSRHPRVLRAAWICGDGISMLFIAAYLVTRLASLPGLVGITGRWDVAPATLAGACALGFLGVHLSVLLGINVAYPHHQQWSD
jgi:hypothetical protein